MSAGPPASAMPNPMRSSCIWTSAASRGTAARRSVSVSSAGRAEQDAAVDAATGAPVDPRLDGLHEQHARRSRTRPDPGDPDPPLPQPSGQVGEGLPGVRVEEDDERALPHPLTVRRLHACSIGRSGHPTEVSRHVLPVFTARTPQHGRACAWHPGGHVDDPREHPLRRRIPDAGRVGRPRRLLPRLARAHRQLARRRQARPARLACAHRGDRERRAGDGAGVPPSVRNARGQLPPHVRLVETTTNDAWVRDTGPTFVRNDGGEVRGVSWRFNAWGGLRGGLYFPWDADDLVGPQGLRPRAGRGVPARPGPRRRLDRRRRRGHGADDRGVPAQPQPQPGSRPRARSRGPARPPRHVEGDLAPARRAPRRDRRPRRQHGALRSPGCRHAHLDRRRVRPAVRALRRGARRPRVRRPTRRAAAHGRQARTSPAPLHITAEEAAGVDVVPGASPAGPASAWPGRT